MTRKIKSRTRPVRRRGRLPQGVYAWERPVPDKLMTFEQSARVTQNVPMPGDYTAVANALVLAIHDVIANGLPGTTFTGVPGMFQSYIPTTLIPAMAGSFAKTAVDALDKHREAVGT